MTYNRAEFLLGVGEETFIFEAALLLIFEGLAKLCAVEHLVGGCGIK
jgi:hypothetical protein